MSRVLFGVELSIDMDVDGYAEIRFDTKGGTAQSVVSATGTEDAIDAFCDVLAELLKDEARKVQVATGGQRGACRVMDADKFAKSARELLRELLADLGPRCSKRNCINCYWTERIEKLLQETTDA